MGNSCRSPTTWTCASQAPRGTSKATVVFGFGPAAETRFKLAIETHKALAVLNSGRRVSMGLQSLGFLRGVPPHSGNGRHRPRHQPILRSHSTDRSGEAPSDQRGADPRIIRPLVVLVSIGVPRMRSPTPLRPTRSMSASTPRLERATRYGY